MFTHRFPTQKCVVLKETISVRLHLVHLPENTNIKAALFTEFKVIKQEKDDNIQYINSYTSY
jgi:hypothetical protein